MNQIYTSDLLSFQKRLAPTVDSDVVIDRPKTEILPEPYVITHERKIRFKLYYPNARKVEMWDYLKEYKLEKNGDYWCGEFDMGEGFIAIFLKVVMKSTHNRRERPVHGHRGGSRGRFYYRITTFEGRPWDARDPYKTTFMALKHEIRLSIWRKQKETPGVEKAPGVSSPQRKESGRSGRDDGELRFWVRPGHPYKAVTSISQAEALAHGLTHLHHLVFAAVLARELDWCAALQDAREDARPWGVVGIGLRSDVWVEVRRDDHRPAVLVT